jgi:hypothetical protein
MLFVPRLAKAVKGKKPWLIASDAKVMAVLENLRNRQSTRVVIHANIAQAIGIPLGAIGRSLRTLVVAGSIQEGPKDAFRLVGAESRHLRRAGLLLHTTDPLGARPINWTGRYAQPETPTANREKSGVFYTVQKYGPPWGMQTDPKILGN